MVTSRGRVAVLGGGVAGLTAATELAERAPRAPAGGSVGADLVAAGRAA
ncbi:hypothetical protein [Kitasatospora sp. MBT66]|nr:hypothetical protein [Kitasatospora sp. MBT66]